MNEEMKKAMAGKAMPELAIVDNNTLAALGLKVCTVASTAAR